MENFIRIYDDVLSAEFCAEVIRRFNAAKNTFAGEVIGPNGESVVSRKQKRTTELVISELAEWEDVETELRVRYVECINRYAEAFPHVSALVGQLYPEVFRIKKYSDEDFFNWHIDCGGENFHRILAIQYYFNDVDNGGETEFQFQDVKVKSVRGRIVMFPTVWTYYHRGATVHGGPKYICTNYVKINPTLRS